MAQNPKAITTRTLLAIAPLAILMLCIGSSVASAKPRVIDNADLRYSVTVPSECRTEEGPGTLEAICAPDFDEAKSAELPAAAAFLLEVDAERAPPTRNLTAKRSSDATHQRPSAATTKRRRSN